MHQASHVDQSLREPLVGRLPGPEHTFRLGETLAKALVRLATGSGVGLRLYTYSFHVNRLLGSSQLCLRELWT